MIRFRWKRTYIWLEYSPDSEILCILGLDTLQPQDIRNCLDCPLGPDVPAWVPNSIIQLN